MRRSMFNPTDFLLEFVLKTLEIWQSTSVLPLTIINPSLICTSLSVPPSAPQALAASTRYCDL
jgi:hypothetical protein